MSEAKSESTESFSETTPPAEPSKQSVLRRYYPAAVPVVLGLIIYFMPVPDGVDPKGMHMLGIFVGTIVALILQPLPTGSVALVGLSIAMITQTETPTEALSGFSNTTIWLIVASFFIAEGFLVTGLGKRVALMFVTKLGKSSLGLSYGMALTDLILAPATPSNTARAGGVVYPIIVSLSKLEDSNPEPEDSRKKLGAYLLLTSLQVNVVTSAMFITAMAGNPVAVDAAAKIGIDISWGKWALAASVPGIASLIAIPWVMSKIFPPTMLKTPKAPEQAREELRKAGPISRNEKIMAATFVLLLVLWCLGSQLNVNATTTAFVGIGILLVTKVLTWNNLVHDTGGAWQTLVFFAVLVGMASHLEELGVISWIGTQVSSSVDGLPWIWLLRS